MSVREVINKHIDEIEEEIKSVKSSTLKAELLKAKSIALLALRTK